MVYGKAIKEMDYAIQHLILARISIDSYSKNVLTLIYDDDNVKKMLDEIIEKTKEKRQELAWMALRMERT